MADVRKSVGSKIRHYRERLGLSQETLALDVGVSKPTISLIETGKSWPQYDNLEAIAKRLGLTVANLFDDVRPEIKPTVDEALEVIRQALASRVQAQDPRVEASPPAGRNYAEPAGEPQDPDREELIARLAALDDSEIRSLLAFTGGMLKAKGADVSSTRTGKKAR